MGQCLSRQLVTRHIRSGRIRPAISEGAASVVGFISAGAARVPGLGADPPLLDVGIGMKPDLVGKGRGSEFGRAVLETLRQRGQQVRYRVVAKHRKSLR
jgi:hypothetical protein